MMMVWAAAALLAVRRVAPRHHVMDWIVEALHQSHADENRLNLLAITNTTWQEKRPPANFIARREDGLFLGSPGTGESHGKCFCCQEA